MHQIKKHYVKDVLNNVYINIHQKTYCMSKMDSTRKFSLVFAFVLAFFILASGVKAIDGFRSFNLLYFDFSLLIV